MTSYCPIHSDFTRTHSSVVVLVPGDLTQSRAKLLKYVSFKRCISRHPPLDVGIR